MKRKGATFEQAMEKLRESVDRLEKGGLTLEETLAAYEEGNERAKECQRILEEAKGRLMRLEEGPDGVVERRMEEPKEQ